MELAAAPLQAGHAIPHTLPNGSQAAPGAVGIRRAGCMQCGGVKKEICPRLMAQSTRAQASHESLSSELVAQQQGYGCNGLLPIVVNTGWT